jgi:hypothetical protein
MPCSLQLYGDLIMCTSDVSAIVSQGPFQCEKLIQPPSEHRPACHHATAPHSSLAQIWSFAPLKPHPQYRTIAL